MRQERALTRAHARCYAALYALTLKEQGFDRDDILELLRKRYPAVIRELERKQDSSPAQTA